MCIRDRQCVEVESKCMNTISKNNHDIQNKIVDLDNKCKQDVQSVQENMEVISENYLKYVSDNTNKFKIIEQNMFEIKDELHVVGSQKSNNVAERIIYTRDAKDEVELETFCNENRRVHPMQFLNRVREFNRFNSNSWEVKLLKILKCFKGNSEICLLYTSRCV